MFDLIFQAFAGIIKFSNTPIFTCESSKTTENFPSNGFWGMFRLSRCELLSLCSDDKDILVSPHKSHNKNQFYHSVNKVPFSTIQWSLNPANNSILLSSPLSSSLSMRFIRSSFSNLLPCLKHYFKSYFCYNNLFCCAINFPLFDNARSRSARP